MGKRDKQTAAMTHTFQRKHTFQKRMPLLVLPLLLFTLALVPTATAVCFCSHRLDVLMELYTATSGSAWTRPWDLAAADAPCTFEGVMCDGGDVTVLDVSRRGLSGTLPSMLGQLHSLTVFNASDNSITGTVPVTLSKCTKLGVLALSGNLLEGTLPPSLGACAALLHFDVSDDVFCGLQSPIWFGACGVCSVGKSCDV
jgi:hypothetical protein